MVSQIFIATFGLTAIWLSQDKRPNWARWACVFGLLGQPFWFYSMYQTEQWGILLLCVFYTLAWARGVRSHWLGG